MKGKFQTLKWERIPFLQEQKADARVELPWGSQTNPGLGGNSVMLPTMPVRTQEHFPVRARAGSMNTERGEEAIVRQLKQIGAERYR